MTGLLIAVGLAIGVVAVFIGSGRIGRSVGFDQELSRKLVHVVICCVGAGVVFVIPDRLPLLISCTILAAALPLGAKLGLFSGVVSDERNMRGPMWFLAAYALLLWLEPNSVRLAAGVLVLGIADSAACLVGRTWGRTTLSTENPRTWLGVAAFVAATVTVLILLGPALGLPPVAIPIVALSVALIVAALEAISHSSLDNFVVPVSVVLLCRVVAGWDADRAMLHLVEIAATVLVAALALRKRWLTGDGALAVMAIGGAVTIAGGPAPALVIFGFFASSSILTKLRPDLAVQKDAKEGRGARQAIAFGVVPALCIVLQNIFGDPAFQAAFVASIAAAAADTWSTEIGRRSRAMPVLATTWTSVPRGTSGGITSLGTMGAAAGGLFVAALAGSVSLIPWTFVPAVVAIGLGASLLDSVLGASLQVQYRCGACGMVSDIPVICEGESAQQDKGITWFDNEAVNLTISVTAALSALALA